MMDEQRSLIPGEISCLLTWTDATELSLAVVPWSPLSAVARGPAGSPPRGCAVTRV